MLTEAQALEGALAKLPPGWAWVRDPDSNWGRTFTPQAQEQVRFELQAEAMLAEATPSTSTQLLPDYERVLGPDPCLAALPATLQERRASVHLRWTRTGGAARKDYIALAAALGYAITTDEFQPSRAGRMRAGDRVRGQRAQWTWRINLPHTLAVRFRAGQSRAGERLLTFGLPWLQCQLSQNTPAHTLLLFANQV